MQVQSCCFANVNHTFLSFSLPSPSSLLMLLIVLIPKFYYVILFLSILTEIKLFRVRGFLLHRLYSNKKPSAKHSIQRGGGEGKLLSIHSLPNEIQTMFSQVVKLSSKVLIADLCTTIRIASSTKDQRFCIEKEQNHGGRRRNYFSLFYFDNSQIF